MKQRQFAKRLHRQMAASPSPPPPLPQGERGDGFPAGLWQGRRDVEETGFAGRWHEVVRPLPAAGPGLVLLGFASDAGVVRNQGRAGAAAGPGALRRALANVPLAASAALYDAGDVICAGDALEAAQDDYANAVTRLLADGHRVIGLGGGHEIARGAFAGLFAALQASGERAPRIGIVNFDAHFDLRAGDRATSGTPFRQIAEQCASAAAPFAYFCLGVSRFANTAALFERARGLGVHWRLDEALTLADLDAARTELDAFAAGVDHLYLTICLDVLPPDLAPGVSAPSARGVELAVIEPLIDRIVGSRKLRLADIAELNPGLDLDQRTARVAARLLARIADGWRVLP